MPDSRFGLTMIKFLKQRRNDEQYFKQVKRKADRPNKTDELLPKRERMIPPHIVGLQGLRGQGDERGRDLTRSVKVPGV